MRKLFAILLTASMIAMLIGCGSSSDKPAQNTTQGASNAATTSDSENTDKEEIQDEQVQTTLASDGVMVFDDYTIEIIDYKVIPAGEEGNEYGDEPVIAFWYNTTNTSGKDTNPMNDPNIVNELNGASLPDSRFLDSQMATIKEGGTIENAMAYTLTDDTTPVLLQAKKNMFGDVFFEQLFELK